MTSFLKRCVIIVWQMRGRKSVALKFPWVSPPIDGMWKKRTDLTLKSLLTGRLPSEHTILVINGLCEGWNWKRNIEDQNSRTHLKNKTIRQTSFYKLTSYRRRWKMLTRQQVQLRVATGCFITASMVTSCPMPIQRDWFAASYLDSLLEFMV